MAGCEEWSNFEEVPPMDATKKRRLREFVASWFLERCLAKDEQETSIDFGKRLSSEFMMPLADKGKLIAVEALDGKRFSGAAAPAPVTAVGKIETGKMDKAKHATVRASGGDKRPFSIISKGAPVDKIQTGKMDKTVVGMLAGAITSGAPVDTAVDNMQAEEIDEYAESEDDFSSITDLAKLLNHSEDWIEKRRQQYEEDAARSKRIREDYMQFCQDWLDQGCEDEEEEDDDDYEANYAKMEALNTMLWNEHCDRLREDNMVSLA